MTILRLSNRLGKFIQNECSFHEVESSLEFDFGKKQLDLDNPISRERTIRFGLNFQDILEIIRPIFQHNFRQKFGTLIFRK